MYTYFLKRVLFFIPTLIIISLFSFLLSLLAPGDQTDQLMQLGDSFLEENNYRKEYKRVAEKTHADLPVFYCSVLPSNFPKDIRSYYVIKRERKFILNHLFEGRSFEAIQNWIQVLDVQIQALKSNETSEIATIRKAEAILYEIQSAHQEELIEEKLKLLFEIDGEAVDSSLLINSFNQLIQVRSSWTPMPVFYWYGNKNQFHYWLKDFFKPNSNISLRDGRLVFDKIGHSLYWTILMLVCALVLSLTITIPLGVYSAYYPDQLWAKWFERISFALYSIPVFWLATILILLFATPYYGMKIFPSLGLFSPGGSEGFFKQFSDVAELLVLPVIILTLHALAFVSRQIKLSMQKEIRQGYFTGALAKGLTIHQALWRHAFPNASLPLVTLITGSIPALIAGTLIIEVIFNIPGMGRLMYDSILGKDWPVVFTVVNLSGIITVFSYLLADIAYMYIDPRIRIQR